MIFSKFLLECPIYSCNSIRIASNFDIKVNRIHFKPKRLVHCCRTISFKHELRPIPSSLRNDFNLLKADEMHVEDAVQALIHSNVIALPTDTLYGLAADACSASAIREIYKIKGRDLNKPLAVCVADVEDIQRFADVDYLPSKLLEELLPGPVTLVLPRGRVSELHPELNPGVTSIGVRIPDQSFIRSVARRFGSALALTSANYSGEKSPLSVREFQSIWNQLAFVFDNGKLEGERAGSTIVDLTSNHHFSIIRLGSAYESTYKKLVKFGLVERKF